MTVYNFSNIKYHEIENLEQWRNTLYGTIMWPGYEKQ
jgi:hypothetical protein